ncbi:MAG: ECF transporter S component [Clostridium sp.]
MNQKTKNLSKFVKISLLSAIAVVIMYLEFPLIPAFPWLKIDLSDVPALMGGFAFGPLAGVTIEGMKILLNLLLTGTQTVFVGEIANFVIGISFILPATYIYWRSKSKKTAIIGMVVGGLSMEVVGIIANLYFLLPAYGMPMTGSAAVNYVVAGLLPFNGIKSVLLGIVTYVLYKKLSVAIFKVDSNFGKKAVKAPLTELN